MSNKLTLEGLSAFKTKIDNKFSLKGHTHSDYATKSELETRLENAGGVSSVNGQTGDVALTIPDAVTESTISGWGFTKNTGTLTSDSTLDATKLSGTIPASCYTVPVQSVNGQTGAVTISTDDGDIATSLVNGLFDGETTSEDTNINVITSTVDLEAGVSDLATGTLYLVYQE